MPCDTRAQSCGQYQTLEERLRPRSRGLNTRVPLLLAALPCRSQLLPQLSARGPQAQLRVPQVPRCGPCRSPAHQHRSMERSPDALPTGRGARGRFSDTRDPTRSSPDKTAARCEAGAQCQQHVQATSCLRQRRTQTPLRTAKESQRRRGGRGGRTSNTGTVSDTTPTFLAVSLQHTRRVLWAAFLAGPKHATRHHESNELLYEMLLCCPSVPCRPSNAPSRIQQLIDQVTHESNRMEAVANSQQPLALSQEPAPLPSQRVTATLGARWE